MAIVNLIVAIVDAVRPESMYKCWLVSVPQRIGGALNAVGPDAPGVIVVYVLVQEPVADAGCCNTALKKSSLTWQISVEHRDTV